MYDMTTPPSIASESTLYPTQYSGNSGTSSYAANASETQTTSNPNLFSDASGAHVEDWNPDKKYKDGDIVRRGSFVSQHYNNGYWKVIEDINSPPEVSSIKETYSPSKGATYEAKQPNGKVWTGENPMGEKDDIKTMSFSDAYIHRDFISADYTGDNLAGVRMSLPIPDAKPVGPHWVNEQQSDGQTLPHCTSSDPSDCTFRTA